MGLTLGIGVIVGIILAWHDLVANVLAAYIEPGRLSGPHVTLWGVLLRSSSDCSRRGIVGDILRRARLVKS